MQRIEVTWRNKWYCRSSISS